MKLTTQFMKIISGLFCMLLLLAPLKALAQTKVVVVPLGDDAKPLKNIITVAKANGNFTDPRAAVNYITDASASNPYLVVIGPGVYTITQGLMMKPYVDIVGSGENITKLTGAISTDSEPTSAIILGANNSTLSSLTVENTGEGDYSIALYNNFTSPKVSNVTTTASGAGSVKYGVYNSNYSSPTMTSVTVTASGGGGSFGVYNSYSSPAMTDVTVTAVAGSSYGVYNESSSPTMTKVTATASGPSSYGIYNASSSPTMTDVTATASGASSYGIANSSSSPIIRRSTMKGDNSSLYTGGGTATVSQSTLIGRADVVDTGTNKCVACDNGSGTALGANCQ